MSLENPDKHDSNYAAAIVALLDRDSNTIQKAMMYPITRIELQEFDGDAVKTTRVLVVDDSGHWVEAQ